MAFLMKLKLSNNDILRGRETHGERFSHQQAVPSWPCPLVQGILAKEVDIRSETRVMMHDIGVSSLGSSALDLQDFQWRTIERF
jgi:hypothetical protein